MIRRSDGSPRPTKRRSNCSRGREVFCNTPTLRIGLNDARLRRGVGRDQDETHCLVRSSHINPRTKYPFPDLVCECPPRPIHTMTLRRSAVSLVARIVKFHCRGLPNQSTTHFRLAFCYRTALRLYRTDAPSNFSLFRNLSRFTSTLSTIGFASSLLMGKCYPRDCPQLLPETS